MAESAAITQLRSDNPKGEDDFVQQVHRVRGTNCRRRYSDRGFRFSGSQAVIDASRCITLQSCEAWCSGRPASAAGVERHNDRRRARPRRRRETFVGAYDKAAGLAIEALNAAQARAEVG